MLIQINDTGTRLTMGFRHVTRGKDKKTICEIRELSDHMSVVLASGLARCSQSDVFSKETGRMLSLTRALESFPKPFRSLAWDTYWNRARYSTAETDFVAAYVPEAGDMTAKEATALAEYMDKQAADALKQDFEGQNGD